MVKNIVDPDTLRTIWLTCIAWRIPKSTNTQSITVEVACCRQNWIGPSSLLHW